MSETTKSANNKSGLPQRIAAGIVALPLTAYVLLVIRNQLRSGLDLIGCVFGAGVAAVAVFCWWFAFRTRSAPPASRTRMQSALRTGCVLGFVGFVSGFFGPMVFSPQSNQGPLLGMFITGPFGFVLGAIIGWLYRSLNDGVEKGQAEKTKRE